MTKSIVHEYVTSRSHVRSGMAYCDDAHSYVFVSTILKNRRYGGKVCKISYP